jgi:hypothetical protein
MQPTNAQARTSGRPEGDGSVHYPAMEREDRKQKTGGSISGSLAASPLPGHAWIEVVVAAGHGKTVLNSGVW